MGLLTFIIYGILNSLSLILIYTGPVSEAFFGLIAYIFSKKTKPLPPIKNKILLMSATKLAEKIRNKELTSEEVVSAYIKRSSEIQPIINAVTDERYDQALRDAKEVDEFLNSTEMSPEDIAEQYPLLGVPFSCKESLGIKDMAQAVGLLREKGRVAVKDCEVATLYKKAGAIPLTVTNVPELSMDIATANLVNGRTNNPYSSLRTCGGSSGGEAAIISAAGALIGLGTDLGGSIRIPACSCGIYGHKPTRGLVSNSGAYPQKEIEEEKKLRSTGPLCRYVEDLFPLLKVLSNGDKRLKECEQVNFKNVKIYYIESFPGIFNVTSAPVKSAIQKAVDYLEKKHNIKACKLVMDEFRYSMEMWQYNILEHNKDLFKTTLAGENKTLCLWWEFFKKLFNLSKHTLAALVFASVEKERKNSRYQTLMLKYESLQKKLQEILLLDTVLLLPTQPDLPPYYFLAHGRFQALGYTAIFNALGLPGTQIPIHIHKGFPVGLQVVGGHFQDHLTIAAALELDEYFHGWKSPCPVEI